MWVCAEGKVCYVAVKIDVKVRKNQGNIQWKLATIRKNSKKSSHTIQIETLNAFLHVLFISDKIAL